MYVATTDLPYPGTVPAFCRGERVPDVHPRLATWLGNSSVVEVADTPASDFTDMVYYRPGEIVITDNGDGTISLAAV